MYLSVINKLILFYYLAFARFSDAFNSSIVYCSIYNLKYLETNSSNFQDVR